MKKFVLGLGVFCVLAVIFIGKAAADGIREGKWSMTMTTHFQGMDQQTQQAMQQMQNMPPEAQAMMQKMNVQMSAGPSGGMTTTITRCVTNQNPVPKSDRTEDCKETHSINGGTVDFQMNCDKPEFQMQSTGHVTYSGNSMSGEIKSHEVTRGRSMDATADISGQYLGPCS